MRWIIALVVVCLPWSAAAQAPAYAQFDSASYAWDAGDFIEALERLERVLTGPRGEEFLARTALLTGELYQVTEVAPDGRAVRWSPDGRYAAFETVHGDTTTTHVFIANADGLHPLMDVAGSGLAFSPAGDRLAYVVVRESPELASARQDVQRRPTGRDRASFMRLRRDLARIDAEHASIVLRELPSGRERRLSPGHSVYSVTFGEGGALYFVGNEKGDTSRTDIYVLGDDGEEQAVTDGPGFKDSPRSVLGGTHLAYTIGRNTVGIVEIATGRARLLAAASPVFSADGSTLAFVAADGEWNTVNVLSLGSEAEPRQATRTPYPVAGGSSSACATCPALSGIALSPDGRRVAYQVMPREDWEIFIAAVDGTGEQQLTRDVQHDLYPHFLSDRYLLAMMGEGRHRRSNLYDLETGERTWLFRNNTTRTVAPEYEWAPSPDGRKLLIVAERDGNTVSPERGVYLLDLSRTVTMAQVLERVRTNLAAERDLRDRAQVMFAPIADDVRAAAADVSVSRIYEYEEDLFGFGSKYITQPGNMLAIEYLIERLTAFGYEPELQWFEPRGSRTANVIVTVPGTASPDVVYVVSSHFDSNLRSPGADDNTSGTVALLETARVLARRPMAATIQLAFFTGEEAGLLGSREYVRRAVDEGVMLVGALNNDMVGWANDHHLDNTIRYSNAGIRDVQHAAAMLFSDLITYDAEYYKSTDAHAYYEAYGDIVGGIGSYPILASPHYHQVHDVLETVSHQLLAEVTKTTVASVMLLASSPSRLTSVEAVRRGETVDVEWAPAVEADVTEYVVSYGPPEDPFRSSVTVSEPRVTLRGVGPGDRIGIKGVNERGLQGWDWAWVDVVP